MHKETAKGTEKKYLLLRRKYTNWKQPFYTCGKSVTTTNDSCCWVAKSIVLVLFLVFTT